MPSSTVMSSKGQLVIPAKLRKELGLRPGVRVIIKRQGKGLHIEPGNLEAVLGLCGMFADYLLEEDLAEERRKWDERLEAM
jgi:AbrB family looped-hinge helix DNA binding protein